jgi:hypothetical protein
MSEPLSLLETTRGNAQVFVDGVKSAYEVELQRDRTGAEWLDWFVQSRSEALDDKTRAGLIELVGCFLGECIIHEYGGEWADQDGRRCVRINAPGAIDPFWMAETCLRYRTVYTVSVLFASVREIAQVRIGGLYAIRDEDGAFRVYKALVVDHVAVHLRKYHNRFEACPAHLEPASLDIHLDLNAWREGGEVVAELPIGHFPLAHEGFWKMEPVLVQVEPVAEEEVDGYRLWAEGNNP